MNTHSRYLFLVLILVLHLLFCFGCGSDSDTSSDGDSDVPSDGDSDSEAEPQDIDPDLALSLQAILDEHVVFSADPGVTLTVRTDDGRWWSGASGIAEMQTDTAMTPDMGFRVGSNTKPFVAAVVLQLVDEGLIGLDDPLTDYLPQYEQWSEITVRQLLSMRSGIIDYLSVFQLMLDKIMDPGSPISPEEILAYLEDEELEFAPGTDGKYTNSNYLLLGMIIENVTGNTVDVEIQARLVEPLGLEMTFLDMTGAIQEQVAHGYMDLSLVGVIFGISADVIGFIPEDAQYDGTIVDCSYLFHPSITWAAGALISNSRDMATFMYALLNGDLLTPETRTEMMKTEDIYLLGARVQYGLGLQKRESEHGFLVGHGGLNFGYQAGTYYLSEIGLTFSHMHNYLPEQSDGLQAELLNLMVDGTDEPLSPCLPPEDFFQSDNGVYVQARFKGPLNELDVEEAVGGIAHIIQTEPEEDTVPLYGWGSQFGFKKLGLQTRLDIDSFGPPISSDAQASLTTISLDPALLDQLDEIGSYSLNLADAGAVITTVADLYFEEDTTDPIKLCYVGVTDFTRESTINIGNLDAFSGELGQTMKFFGSLALETDATAVAATMETIGLPVCLCIDEDENWGACPVE